MMKTRKIARLSKELPLHLEPNSRETPFHSSQHSRRAGFTIIKVNQSRSKWLKGGEGLNYVEPAHLRLFANATNR
jgi:hypothetical protein